MPFAKTKTIVMTTFLKSAFDETFGNENLISAYKFPSEDDTIGNHQISSKQEKNKQKR